MFIAEPKYDTRYMNMGNAANIGSCDAACSNWLPVVSIHSPLAGRQGIVKFAELCYSCNSSDYYSKEMIQNMDFLWNNFNYKLQILYVFLPINL